jgi:hypothetical protein
MWVVPGVNGEDMTDEKTRESHKEALKVLDTRCKDKGIHAQTK